MNNTVSRCCRYCGCTCPTENVDGYEYCPGCDRIVNYGPWPSPRPDPFVDSLPVLPEVKDEP